MTINGLGGQYSGQSLPLSEGSMVFGRNPSSCNVLFSDDTKGVSRMHCKIELNGGNATITDLGSSYGTFVNGMKIQPYTPRVLNNGDTFYLGDKKNMFSVSNAGEAVPAVGVPGPAPIPAKNPNDKSVMIAVIVLLSIIIVGLIMYFVQRNSTPWYMRAIDDVFGLGGMGGGSDLEDVLGLFF